jgi:hypothetical protein
VSVPSSPQVIAGDEALADFRQGLTGELAFSLLAQFSGGLLVQLPVGVGKTAWLVHIIVHALAVAGRHDLVVVLVPRRDILGELRGRLPAGLDAVVLSPRPRSRCGDLDEEWQQYEQHGCGLLGRHRLCAACPRRGVCPWPGQYGKNLRGARLILATQQHLAVNPWFVDQLRQHTRAANPLVLVDESDFLVRSLVRYITREELDRFFAAWRAVLAQGGLPAGTGQSWLTACELFADAPTGDLQAGGWRFPWVDPASALAVQLAGQDLYGPGFRFLGHELHAFARSDPQSRQRTPAGDVRFAVPPYLGDEFILFSGSVAQALARYRLDPDYRRPAPHSPFAGLRFEHPGTRWYNIRWVGGSARYFRGNATTILDFFAEKVARNIREGKRTLLVARKKYRGLCREYLQTRLGELEVGPVRVVTGNWDRHDLDDPRVLPLINYGVSGVNRFEHCEVAYCLTGYYTNPAAVTQALHDLDPTAVEFKLQLHCTGEPMRRAVTVSLPDDRDTILPDLAEWVLEQKEADVVVQAVGRVRPFTRPREVITFHLGPLPGVQYTYEFQSLSQARAFFNVPTRRQAQAKLGTEAAWQLRAEGLSRRGIATRLRVSLATVKRYLRGVVKVCPTRWDSP